MKVNNLTNIFFLNKAILATVAAILFGWEIDNVDVVNRNYALSRGVSFYLQVRNLIFLLTKHNNKTLKIIGRPFFLPLDYCHSFVNIISCNGYLRHYISQTTRR